MPAKQVIVVRKDLNMRKGKLIAQGSHASIKAVLYKWRKDRAAILAAQIAFHEGELEMVKDLLYTEPLTPAEEEWYFGNFRKICVYVNSEAELVALHEAALAKGLTSHMIEDHGLTEFHGVLTKTCIAIGPCFDEDVDALTGSLPLL